MSKKEKRELPDSVSNIISKTAQTKKTTPKKTEIVYIYCRVCQKNLSQSLFYSATNPFLDKNGRMSVCANCIEDIYDRFNKTYNNQSKAIYSTCKELDISYNEMASTDTIEYFENTKSSKIRFMGKYKALMSNRQRGRNLRFRDSGSAVSAEMEDEVTDKHKELIATWGVYSDEEYEFLERTYKEYINAYGANSPSERDNFRILCILKLNFRNNPTNKDYSDAIGRQYKICGITPEQISKRQSEKGVRTFGIDIATMELTSPIMFTGEWEEQEDRYKDYDGLQQDIEDIKRNIKNFMVEGSHDFDSEGVDIGILLEGEDIDD